MQINPFTEITSRLDNIERLLLDLKHIDPLQKEEKLLSSSELCQKLSISKTTLWAWVNEGRLTQHKIGSRNFYKWSEVLNSTTSLKRYARLEIK
jgi:excisionase family DNA binding protein